MFLPAESLLEAEHFQELVDDIISTLCHVISRDCAYFIFDASRVPKRVDVESWVGLPFGTKTFVVCIDFHSVTTLRSESTVLDHATPTKELSEIMPLAPLAISSQSRKKLKSFAFDEKLIAAQEDKENHTVAETDTRDGSDAGETPGIKDFPDRNVPHTPAVRIPFEDLIANTEDAFNCAPPLATPKDHVLWDPHSSDVSGAATATQRNRKRAQSSSPASSQQFSAQKDALNLETLNRSLRTPNNDPTQDLWNRYTTANALKSAQGEPTLPNYAYLLPSSPQTPSTTSKDSGLRRTHSCGVEWPTSKAKRRRIETNAQHGRTKELFAASRKDILRRDLSNNTRVGLLLEKIQESLTKKAIAADESPSSSSPLPDRHSQAVVSPTRPQSTVRLEQAGQTPDGVRPAQDTTPKAADHQNRSFSSEFDDDGLDMEAFESLEQALLEQAAETSAGAAKNNRDVAATGAPSRSNGLAVSQQPTHDSEGHTEFHDSSRHGEALPAASEAPADFADEFDDDDEELMTEMIDLAAQYDSQRKSPNKRHTPTGQPISQTKAPFKKLETLDEFEDAFDDDDELWEGIANATSVKAGEMDQTNSVRSRPTFI